MDNFQQAIQNIAAQIPGYAGYQAKERRRDADKVLRDQLARQYETQRDHLIRIMQDLTRGGQIDRVDDLDRANQQLQRLITRLKTAPRGYAGWFDAGQIQEADLDQLYQFDSALASHIEKFQVALEAVASAFKNKEGVDDSIATLTDTLDAANAQFNAREEFVALGKRPAPNAPSTQTNTPNQIESGK